MIANLPLAIALKKGNPGGFLVGGVSLATDTIEGGAMDLEELGGPASVAGFDRDEGGSRGWGGDGLVKKGKLMNNHG